ncbi:hypothetical protein M758_11G023700 [Ceratodon purpureus]|nr:hypothetical protein M758_11G023700 [Ceratodon purpureus]
MHNLHGTHGPYSTLIHLPARVSSIYTFWSSIDHYTLPGKVGFLLSLLPHAPVTIQHQPHPQILIYPSLNLIISLMSPPNLPDLEPRLTHHQCPPHAHPHVNAPS